MWWAYLDTLGEEGLEFLDVTRDLVRASRSICGRQSSVDTGLVSPLTGNLREGACTRMMISVSRAIHTVSTRG